MKTVATRELMQNPRAVITRVLETGDEYEITAYGRPTGVRIVRDSTGPSQWVDGARLADITPLSRRGGAAVMTSNVADFRPFDSFVEIVEPVRRRDA